MRTGETYVASGKFEFSKVFTSAFVGVVVACVLGVVYAFISELNPFIYLNVLVLIGLVYAMSFIIQKVALYGKSRNIMVNIIVGLVVCFFAWYAHWCFYFAKYGEMNYFSVFFHPVEAFEYLGFFAENRVISVGKAGRSSNTDVSGIVLQICYVIEFGAFMWAAIANRKPAYYSEKNNCLYTSVQCYAEANDFFKQSFEKATPGNYAFLSLMDLYPKTDGLPLQHNDKIVQLDFHFCDEGEDNSILTITEGKLKIDKKKNERNFSSGKKLVKDIYVNAETDNAILRKNVPETVEEPAD